MSNKIVLLVVALVCLLKTALAVSVDIPAHETECFYEELNYGDRVSLTYQVNSCSSRQTRICFIDMFSQQVGEGGDYDIDFWVTKSSKKSSSLKG